MPFALFCEASRTFALLPRHPLRVADDEGRVPAEVFGDFEHAVWNWGWGTLVEIAPAVAACDAMAEHAAQGCQVVLVDEDPFQLVGFEQLSDDLEERVLGDRGERTLEPELRARIGEDGSGPRAEREHALHVARAWSSEPAERDRLIRLGCAEAFVRDYRETRCESRHVRALPEGSELRRDAYRRIVDWTRGEGSVRIRAGLRLAFRELGADDEATERLRADLCAQACDSALAQHERAGAASLLLEHWPRAHVALREGGQLESAPLPSWPDWDRVRHQHELALLLATSQDPAELERVLGDASVPAGCQLPAKGDLPRDRWAIEAAAGVAAKLASVERELAARFEPLVRRRFLERPEAPRHGPRRLLAPHLDLVLLLDPVEGMHASLEVIERALDQAAWEETGAARYTAAWHRQWGSGRALALLLLRRVRDASRSPAQRLAARQALADLAHDVRTRKTPSVDGFVGAANATLLAALRDERSSPELRVALAQHLDRFLSPQQVLALRAEGLLEAAPLPPYGDVPGAALGLGNTLYPALDDLTRKVELVDVLETLERLPAREAEDDLARGITALALLDRLAKRYPQAGADFEAVLRPLLGEAKRVEHTQRSWQVDQMALKAYLELLPGRLKASDDLGELARGALAGVLCRPLAPESYYSKHGPHGAQALTKALARALTPELKASLAGWLEERALDPECTPYARLNARWGIEGLGSAELLDAADRRLLTVLADGTEDAELREELHALLAPRFPDEVRALQDEGVLPALGLPPIEALHVPVQGGVQPHEGWLRAVANRQHPGRLIEALADPETELGELCTGLLCAPSAAARGANPGELQDALHALLGDRREHAAGGGRWVLAKLAAEADVARLGRKRPDAAQILAGLEAALVAEAPETAKLYAIHPERRDASRARNAHGPFVARGYAVALAKADRPAALDALEAALRDEARAGVERLAALDAFSQVALTAPRAEREALAKRRAELLGVLEAAQLVSSGAVSGGLCVPMDWDRRGLPGFAWVGETLNP